ncbi:hypothetical protein C8F04DRAFT_1193989 [Mycena alexandri]|uniref:Transmembrane protein n=1 Tax=Mycena alexandri TaxID=1745969 RepID=A0AAD6S8Q2_9AGAR|nr:hypothetical protein C8F04DRAFT_1193989 [Mycena alexandri]
MQPCNKKGTKGSAVGGFHNSLFSALLGTLFSGISVFAYLRDPFHTVEVKRGKKPGGTKEIRKREKKRERKRAEKKGTVNNPTVPIFARNVKHGSGGGTEEGMNNPRIGPKTQGIGAVPLAAPQKRASPKTVASKTPPRCHLVFV